MPLHDIRRLIGGATELESLREKTRGLALMQQAYVDCFPAEFAALTQAELAGLMAGASLRLPQSRPQP